MGRKTAELAIFARLSNHNDEQDDLDRAAWERFTAAVKQLAKQPEYEGIEISFMDRGAG